MSVWIQFICSIMFILLFKRMSFVKAKLKQHFVFQTFRCQLCLLTQMSCFLSKCILNRVHLWKSFFITQTKQDIQESSFDFTTFSNFIYSDLMVGFLVQVIKVKNGLRPEFHCRWNRMISKTELFQCMGIEINPL